MKRIIEFFVHRNILGNMVTVGVIGMGIIALLNMHREVFPKVDFDIVTIVTVYPGASPQEVEKLIINPLEDELKLDDIKRTDSTAIEGRAAIVITLEPDLSKNKIQVIQDIKDAVDRAKQKFPEEAEEPVVSEVSTTSDPIIEIAISSYDMKVTKSELDQKLVEATGSLGQLYAAAHNSQQQMHLEPLSEIALRREVKQLSDKIELIPDVAGVVLKGYRDREFHVEVNPAKMAANNVSIDSVIKAIKGRNVSLPGGNIVDVKKGEEFIVRTSREFKNTQEVENTFIRASDVFTGRFAGATRVKDIATVKDTFKEKDYIEKVNGKEAIVLTVLKKETGDAITLVKKVKDVLDSYRLKAPANIEIVEYNDFSFYIKRRLKVLSGNVTIGMILVIVTLLFFLGWRVSLMVALGIPFSFGITFLLMGYFDISISLISMFGLIIVSGMLVDDAIVVGENIYRHIEQGEAPIQAAINGTKEMVAPIFGAISTTAVAFFPLMSMTGIIGKFVWYIPATVVIALAASLFESFFILPAHVSDINKHADPDAKVGIISRILQCIHNTGNSVLNFLKSVYGPILEFSLRYRYTTVIIVFFAFLSAFLLIPQIGFKLFPDGGIEKFFVKAEGKSGTSLESTNENAAYLENAILDLPKNERKSFVTRVGIHQEDATDPFTKRGKHYVQMNVFLTPEEQRSRKATEIISFLKGKTEERHPIHYIGEVEFEGRRALLRVTNNKNIFFHSLDNPEKVIGKIKVGDHFIIGGGLAREKNHILLLTSYNDMLLFDYAQKKILKQMKVKQRLYDAPARFYVIPNSNSGLMITEKSAIDFLNLDNQQQAGLPGLGARVTDVKFSAKKKELYLSTDLGSFEVFSFDVPGDVSDGLAKKVTTLVPLIIVAIAFAALLYFKRRKWAGKKFRNIAIVSGAILALVIIVVILKPKIPLEKKYRITKSPRVKRDALKGFSFHSALKSALPKIEKIELSADGKLAYLACFDGVVRVVDIEKKEIVNNIGAGENPLYWVKPHEVLENSYWISQADSLALYQHEKGSETLKPLQTWKLTGEITNSVKVANRSIHFGSYDTIVELKGQVALNLKVGQRIFEKIEFKQVGGGPPVGSPVQIEIRGGDHMEDMLAVKDKVKEKLATIEGVYDIRDNWEDGKIEFHPNINERTAALAGVPFSQVGLTLLRSLEGEVATSIKKADEEIDIRVIYPKRLREDLDTLRQIKVQNSIGNLLPITNLTTVKTKKDQCNEYRHFRCEQGVAAITHSALRPTVFVKANIDERKSSSVIVNNEMKKLIKPVLANYSGIEAVLGGEYEDTQESMQSLGRAALWAMVGIGGILVLLFGNIRQPRVIMSAIPLGLIGVVLAFFIHKVIALPNLVFSFLASMGIVGLTGVVVNDSIVLVDSINKMRKAGYGMREAVVSGGISRLRAVMLTTITTAAGLMPTAYGIGGDDPFLKPMALAMAWGLVFATVITLIIIPVYYTIWEERGFVFHHVISKKLRSLSKRSK